MTQKTLQGRVLKTLKAYGKTKPAVLVHEVEQSTKASRREVEDALHVLVDKRQVALTWHGELEVHGG